MKKLLAIIMAMVMVLSLTVIAAADDEVVFEFSTPYAYQIGWTTLFEHGSEDALALYEALATEGAVFKMIGTDLTEADMPEGGAWFQLCTQDQAGWTPDGDFKTEDVGETYEFTDDGYTITVPADVIYAALSSNGLEASSIGFILNAGNWDKLTTNVTVKVVVPAAAPETPAETAAETPAETPAAPETGLALAVVPAVMALAAVAVTKRR